MGGLAGDRRGFYYLGLVVWIAARILEQSMVPVVAPGGVAPIKGLELAGLLLIVIDGLISYSIVRTSMVQMVAILALAACTVATSQRLYFLQLTIIVLVGRNASLNKSLKCAFFAILATCGLIVLMSLFSIIPNYLFLWGGRERLGLGFKYVTYLPAFALSLILLFACLFRDKIGCVYLIAVIVIEAVLFFLTDSRLLCFLGLSAAVLVVFVSWRREKKNASFYLLGLTPLVFVLFPILSYAAAAYYDPNVKVLHDLNSLLSNRLALGNSALDQWGIHLFGQDVEFNAVAWENGTASLPAEVNVVDSSYLSSLVVYGALATVVFMAGYFLLALRAKKEGDAVFLVALFSVALMGLTEPRLLILEYNPFILAIGAVIGVGQNTDFYRNNFSLSMRSDLVFQKDGKGNMNWDGLIR